MNHISFVILHYMSYDYTRDCIESILDTITYKNYSILIVDNHSPNDSVQRLRNNFGNDPRIIILLSESNSGFAKGNNIGYSYAKHTLHSTYVIAANNDTIFTQHDFIEEMLSLFQQHKFYILGPDILSLENKHQNPYRSQIIEYKSALKWIRNRRLWTFYLKLDKRFHLSNKLPFAQRFYENRVSSNDSSPQHQVTQSDVVLQGACIIFSPLYMQEMDYAFYPETYMYCEEDILAYQCKKKGWNILYSPTLTIRHVESGSTKDVLQNNIDKELFLSENIVKSLKILIRIIKKAEK